MKTFVVWIFVLIWFLHLAVGAAAGIAALRIWSKRKERFVGRLLLALHAPMIASLMAIVLVFMAKNVKLTWKFSVTVFAGVVAIDVVIMPLLLLLIKGLKDES